MTHLSEYFQRLALQDEYDRCEDERDLPPNKRADYAERMFEAADWRRKEMREEGYEQTEAGDRLWTLHE